MFSNKENANASKILVVDDEQDIVTIIDKVLKKSGYEVITANDGLECLDKMRDELPDLKVKRYQKLLPFYNKNGKQFDELGKYLVSDVI